MKVVKPYERRQCCAIIKPGEFTVNYWDGTQCSERHVMQLIRCDHCGNWYCLMKHWGKHLDDMQSLP